MGHIDRFNLQNIIKEYDISYFLETGTGYGVSLEHSIKFNFKKIYTIEIIEQFFKEVQNKFSDNRIQFINNNSKDGLNNILNQIESGNILFWLDAHFPGADFGLSSYDSTKEDHLRIPLESELRMIKEIRDTKNDYFIIDDLRIYEDGPFQGGNWEDRNRLGGDNIHFIHELFEETHSIHKDYRDQGYIILIPKK